MNESVFSSHVQFIQTHRTVLTWGWILSVSMLSGIGRGFTIADPM